MGAKAVCATQLLSHIPCLRQTSLPMTYVLAKSASRFPKTGPRSMKAMSSSCKTLSGMSTCIGWTVFLPVRTRRLCQCLRVPNSAAASLKISSLISLSLSPAFKKSAQNTGFQIELWLQFTKGKAVLLIKAYQKLVPLHDNIRSIGIVGELVQQLQNLKQTYA